MEIVFPKLYFPSLSLTYAWNFLLNLQQDSEAGVSAISEPSTPERVFKVVFVGDSGVGKSSFIHRFCHGAWKPSFTATIGNTSHIVMLVDDDKSDFNNVSIISKKCF